MEQLEQMGQVEQVVQVEQVGHVEQVQVQVQLTEEAMAQLRGCGRDGGRLYADIVRQRRVSTANTFEVLQGEKRDEVIYMGHSIVRTIDRTVCRGRKETTTTVSPGASVDDVRKRVGQVMGPGNGGGRFVCTWGRTTPTRTERQRSWVSSGRW